jgi:cell division septation protein DedD
MSYHLGPADPQQRAELFVDPGDEPLQPRPRRMFATALVLLVMALFGGGLWFAYVQGTRHAGGAGAGGEVPLIRADERPTKVKPERPGGMEIPDRDKLIYNPTRPVVEHLLPPAEKPMPRPTPTPAVPAQTEAPPATAAAAPAASGPPLNTPAPAAASPPQQPAAASPGKAAQAASATPKPPAAPSPAKVGGTRLQLGSVRNEEAARQEWERIKSKNADLIGNLSVTPVRADLGDKGIYYRIQTAPVADPATAERICSELRQRGIGCIIAR